MNNSIKLQSKDNQEVSVKLSSIKLSKTVLSIISLPESDDAESISEYSLPSEPVPLNTIDYSILLKVVEYCDYHSQNKNELSEKDTISWNEEFLSISDDELFNIILAANYLEINCLLDLTCKKVADVIKKCNSPKDIRRRFNIKNDFTPEEEEEVRKENSWVDEK